jgi:RHS repeat-associated protein
MYNGHGDVAGLTDASGALAKTYRYDAFGNEASPVATDTNPFRYAGGYFDRETGDYYLRARQYDPPTGRFASEDPIKDGLNYYAYCYNNPTAFIDPSGLKIIALRSTIEKLGGVVSWDDESKVATAYLDGQSVRVNAGDSNGSFLSNGKMYTDDAWIFAALGSTFSLGKGWTGRIERGTAGNDYQRHVHIYNGKQQWAQNEDGSPHDGGSNSPGSPPNSTLKNLNKQKDWDWKRKEKDWLNKIETGTDYDGYHFVFYPSGRTVTIYKPESYSFMPYSPSTQDLRDYSYGPTYVDLSEGSASANPSIPFLPMPNLVPIPLPAPMPIPVFP